MLFVNSPEDVKKCTHMQEQRKQSFLTLPKENQSPLGLYRNPPTFFFTNPRFVLLIRDRRFVLFSLHVHHLITQRQRPMSSAGTASKYDSQRKCEKSVYCV